MKKCLSFLLTFIFLMFLTVFIVCFAQEPVWVISDDAKAITNGQKVYTIYEMPAEIEFVPENEIRLYRITDSSNENLYKYEYVAQINDNVAYMYNSDEVFVTEEGRRLFDSFIKGEYSYYLYHVNHNSVVDFSADRFEKFMDEENKTEIDVTTLWNDEVFYVRGFDKTGCFAHKCGAVYQLEDSYYYIHYDSLDNTYFDAYGDFSFRKGLAPAYKLTGDNERFVKEAKNTNKSRFEEFIYPEEEVFTADEDKAKALTSFIIIPVVFGFIIPIVPLILSIKFANSKKSINSKRWYWLTVFSALWIIVSLIIVLLFIL